MAREVLLLQATPKSEAKANSAERYKQHDVLQLRSLLDVSMKSSLSKHTHLRAE